MDPLKYNILHFVINIYTFSRFKLLYNFFAYTVAKKQNLFWSNNFIKLATVLERQVPLFMPGQDWIEQRKTIISLSAKIVEQKDYFN